MPPIFKQPSKITKSMKLKQTFLTAAFTFIFTAAHAAPLTIEKQGSFTIGGSHVTHDGTFRPENFTAPSVKVQRQISFWKKSFPNSQLLFKQSSK